MKLDWRRSISPSWWSSITVRSVLSKDSEAFLKADVHSIATKLLRHYRPGWIKRKGRGGAPRTSSSVAWPQVRCRGEELEIEHWRPFINKKKRWSVKWALSASKSKRCDCWGWWRHWEVTDRYNPCCSTQAARRLLHLIFGQATLLEVLGPPPLPSCTTQQVCSACRFVTVECICYNVFIMYRRHIRLDLMKGAPRSSRRR